MSGLIQHPEHCNLCECMFVLNPTTCFVQKNRGHQELPGIMEESFLYEVEGRPRGCPLLEGFPPGWAKSWAWTVYISLKLHTYFYLINVGIQTAQASAASCIKHYHLCWVSHWSKDLFSACLPSFWTLSRQERFMHIKRVKLPHIFWADPKLSIS